MALDHQTELAPTDVDELLGRHETGVLSLAREEEPYAIPISYGYDADDREFYLRLVSTPESDKRQFLSATPAARLVVYEEKTAVYRSVIASGRLVEIPREELRAEHIRQYGDAKRPLFEIWGEGAEDLDVALYRLEPADISGREVRLDDEDQGE